MADSSALPGGNRLLQSLGNRERKRVLALCKTVDLPFGQVVCHRRERLRYAWFPVDGFISVIAAVDHDEIEVEVGVIGREGMFNVELALDANQSSVHAVVQGAGPVLRLPAADLRRLLATSSRLRRVLHRYAAVTLAQSAITAVCVGSHSLEARMARGLLMCDDRTGATSFRLTQKYLAFMLGVRRAGVSKVASALRHQGIIEYSRGIIFIRDRAGLERVACSCYREGLDAHARLLG